MQSQFTIKYILLLWLITTATSAWSQQDEMLMEEDLSTEIEISASSTNQAAESLTGIYASEDDPSLLFSLHVKDDEIVLLDISGHLGFLQKIGYLSAEEAEQNIAVSSYDRVLQGKLFITDPDNNTYSACLNPILPLAQRASKHSENRLTYCYPANKSAFLALNAYHAVKINDEQPTSYTLSLSRDGGIIYFFLGEYHRIF